MSAWTTAALRYRVFFPSRHQAKIDYTRMGILTTFAEDVAYPNVSCCSIKNNISVARTLFPPIQNIRRCRTINTSSFRPRRSNKSLLLHPYSGSRPITADMARKVVNRHILCKSSCCLCKRGMFGKGRQPDSRSLEVHQPQYLQLKRAVVGRILLEGRQADHQRQAHVIDVPITQDGCRCRDRPHGIANEDITGRDGCPWLREKWLRYVCTGWEGGQQCSDKERAERREARVHEAILGVMARLATGRAAMSSIVYRVGARFGALGCSFTPEFRSPGGNGTGNPCKRIRVTITCLCW